MKTKLTRTQIARNAVRAAGLTWEFCYTDKRANGRRRLKFYIREYIHPELVDGYFSRIRRSLGQKHVPFKKLEFSLLRSQLTITV